MPPLGIVFPERRSLKNSKSPFTISFDEPPQPVTSKMITTMIIRIIIAETIILIENSMIPKIILYEYS